MAEALIAGLLASGRFHPRELVVADIAPGRLEHLRRTYRVSVAPDNRTAAQGAEAVVLAVKPKDVEGAAKEVAPVLAARTLVISLAAGVPSRAVFQWLGGRGRVVRVMPNMPALVREGALAIAPGPRATRVDLKRVEELMAPLGRTVLLEESHLDAVTGLSGSGPAYVFVTIEALADGGVKMGLPREVALLLAAQTVLGAAKMLLESGEHPGRLKDRVASPGGTTVAGLHELERGKVRAAFISAVEAATRRARELGGGKL